jgi:hypothetical protein
MSVSKRTNVPPRRCRRASIPMSSASSPHPSLNLGGAVCAELASMPPSGVQESSQSL